MLLFERRILYLTRKRLGSTVLHGLPSLTFCHNPTVLQALPLFAVLFGDIIDAVNTGSPAAFTAAVNTTALRMLLLGIGTIRGIAYAGSQRNGSS